jgi:hypothetical protein
MRCEVEVRVYMHEPHALWSVYKRDKDGACARMEGEYMSRGPPTAAPLVTLHCVWCVEQKIGGRVGVCPPWVSLCKKLHGCLAKLSDLRLCGCTLAAVSDRRQVYSTFICEAVENVAGVDGGGAALLAAKDKIDPLVQVG